MNPTPQQQKVIDSREGTIIVKACPGSGKTATLVKRCVALPRDETKVVLAFNKKAADEFKIRMGQVSGCSVSTFHSFCLKTIRENPTGFGFAYTPHLNVDGSLFRQMCIANDAPREWTRWDDAEGVWDEEVVKIAEHCYYDSDLLERGKNLALRGDDLDEVEAIELRTLRALYKYRKWLNQCHILTFDSMIRVVAEHRNNIKKAGTHVMVDEYQDVDRFQFDIVCSIAKINGVKSLAVVGDPNQRIYVWRGALEDAFGSMQREFPGSSLLPLTTNFRSHDEIIRFADEICPTGMVGVRGSGAAVDLSGGFDSLVSGLSVNYSSAAILCRYNRDCAHWKLKLARDGIPVYVLGGADFWALKHVRIAKKAWKQNAKLEQVLEWNEWRTIETQKVYRDNPDKLDEIRDDLKWILSLTSSDMRILEENLQNEREGLKIATIHKTKGMEFERVMVSNVDEYLKRDTFLYYVACTRAKNLMVMG